MTLESKKCKITHSVCKWLHFACHASLPKIKDYACLLIAIKKNGYSNKL